MRGIHNFWGRTRDLFHKADGDVSARTWFFATLASTILVHQLCAYPLVLGSPLAPSYIFVGSVSATIAFYLTHHEFYITLLRREKTGYFTQKTTFHTKETNVCLGLLICDPKGTLLTFPGAAGAGTQLQYKLFSLRTRLKLHATPQAPALES